MTKYTVQCGFCDYNANTVTVEADSIEEACHKAIVEANDDPVWKRLDHVGDTYVDAICEGEGDPWGEGTAGSAIPVPPRYTEAGLWGREPQLNARELATVLAALRYWQREGWGSSGHEHEIASDMDTLTPLEAHEIDALCERLNCEPEEPKIVIELDGGLVQTVTMDGKTVSAEIHDYDVGCSPANELVEDDDGKQYLRFYS